MPINNRLREIRHQLMIDKKKDFAKLLSVTPQQISNWENQEQQPNIITLIKLWKRLLPYIPGLNIQDLIDHKDLN